MLRVCITILFITATLPAKLDIGQTIRLRSVSEDYPNYFVSRQSDDTVAISDSSRENLWIVKSSLRVEDKNAISLMSVRSGFLRHQGFDVRVDALGKISGGDASFNVEKGLAGKGISLQSVNFPGKYLRHNAGTGMRLEKGEDSEYKEDASFEVVTVSTWLGESALYLGNRIKC